jgi:hypothetical protein
MFHVRIFLLIAAATLFLSGCPDDGTDPSMDVYGNTPDIPAKEINEFTPVEEKYCVGQQLDEKFAEYDYQCEAAVGKGKCVQMPNPHLGKSFYCTLCGLKGSEMVCYMINPE